MPYGVYTAGTAGDEVSSTYEGRHLTFSESQLTHPYHADGFVDNGDPVVVGDIVGVAFLDAAAATDLIPIDTEGIWQLSVVATNEDGNIAVAVGDQLFINTSTGVISKNPNKNTQQSFGYALYPISTGVTDVIPVKVHWDPDDATELVGVSGAYYSSGAVANTFREYRYTCAATSGSSQGIYCRLQLTGAGTVHANAGRLYTEVVGVEIANAYGLHVTVGFGESTVVGKVTGQAQAIRAQVGVPNGAGLTGTLSAVAAEFWSWGASSTIATTNSAFLRCINAGDGTGIANVDDNAFLLVYDGGSIAGGNIVEASATEANYAYSARCRLNGTTAYMMFASAVG